MVPILEAASDPRVRQVTAITASQLGKTSALLSIVGHRFHDGPRSPCLLVMPTQKLAGSMSADRVARLLRECRALDDLHLKGKKDSKFEKWIGGVPLRFAWAGSATELAAHPSGLILCDEIDRYDGDVGGEGDPVALAMARCKNFAAPLLVLTSSPTIEDASRIQSQFDLGSMEVWEFRCPHCGDYHRPLGAYLTWPDGATPMVAEMEGRYCCPRCGAVIEESQRRGMSDAGRMYPYHRDADGEYLPNATGEIPDQVHRSFWVSGLASPWVSFATMARTLCGAYRTREPEDIQAKVNTWLGELWRTRGDAPEWEEVARHRRGYAPGSLPFGVQVVTVGVDVQQDRLFYVVRGWGAERGSMESWLVEHGELHGRPDADDVWIALTSLLRRPELRVRRCFVDSGYKPGVDFWKRPDHAVYTWARRMAPTGYACKGFDQRSVPVDSRFIEYTDSGGRTIKNGVQLWRIDVGHFKSQLYSWIHVPDDAADGVDLDDVWHVHRDVSEDYCRQVVAETLITKSSGRQFWQAKKTRPNHYLDCEVLATAAAWSLNVQQLRALPRGGEPDDAPAVRRPASSRFARESL